MSVMNKLASSLNRRDEVPNQELAKQIAAKKDKNAVQTETRGKSDKESAITYLCRHAQYI